MDDLAGTEWSIVRIGTEDGMRESVEGRKRPSIAFHGEGRFSGTTGCNDFFGTFDVTDHGLEAGPVALTRMMCDENLMMQERHITAAIDATRAVEMHEGVPVLVDEDGRPVLEMAFSDSV